LWSSRPPFMTGSSGIEYALTAPLGAPRELLAAPPRSAARPAARRRALIAVSGSCSTVTADPDRVGGRERLRGHPGDAGGGRGGRGPAGDGALEAGRSPLLYYGAGSGRPGDPRRRARTASGSARGWAGWRGSCWRPRGSSGSPSRAATPRATSRASSASSPSRWPARSPRDRRSAGPGRGRTRSTGSRSR
jgi:hypothetical protein